MRIVTLLLLSFSLCGCVGAAIGTATDAAIAIGKVPFKVGGAIVDVATPDNDDEEKEK